MKRVEDSSRKSGERRDPARIQRKPGAAKVGELVVVAQRLYSQ